MFLATTWVLWWVVLIGIGSLVFRRITPTVGARGWIGLFALTAAAMVTALVLPLGDAWARMLGWLVVAVGVLGFVRAGLWQRWRLLVVVAAAAVLLAMFASVQPSNYDLGLYHAGSIAYVREGGTVIGLANLHDRFGFSSSMWPVSAFLGLGLWDGGEFRLVNGLLALLMVGDLVVRLRRGCLRQPGTLLLAFGAVLLLGAVVQYPGRLIASSAQDWAAAVLMVVSTVYLVDALLRPDRRSASTVALLTAAMAGAMRPTGWVFVLVTLLVILVSASRSTGWRSAARLVMPGLTGALVLGIATVIRDALTSGWLLFPAGFFRLPVPWRYPDPSGTSEDITAWARTPFQDPAVTMADASWIPGWLMRLPTDWAVFSAAVLVAVLVFVLIVVPAARAEVSSHRRVVLLAITPSSVVLLTWLTVAPDPRFAWGPLLLVVLVPLVFALSAVSSPRLVPSMLVVGVLGIVAVAFVRGSPLEVSSQLQNMPPVTVEQTTLSDGTEVVVPINGDQCWGDFPMCRPDYALEDIELRGQTWRGGFQPISRLKESQE